ncbi:YigZ family protein [Microbacterium mitrae]|uniref:YigZ family protein n=1 Tax=Microbacterium mitrae TaxID=664640 RepID=A0A5C8HQV9_9MICO|nr:YigZ family protein [Microbacterium mitrae]TXK05662.1 YigZ family protein [Microbacterium mitrae]
MSGQHYLALAAPASAEIEVLRSRFLCTLTPASSDAAAREVWAGTKEQYRDARHHCLAFVIGPDRALRRASDDGEPGGTAGAPMLAVLDGSGVSDIVAVVTRWFGGTLLGTGGLIRAYSDAVRAGLAAAQTVRRELVVQQRFTLPLASAGAVEAELRRRGFAIVSAEWEADVTVTVGSNDATAATLPGILAALTAGTVVPQPAGTRWIDVA